MEEITKPTENEGIRNFNLTSYARAQEKMIATTRSAYDSYSNSWSRYHSALEDGRTYSPEEITTIIERGSLEAQKTLSRHYFNRNGYYKQIVLHYATLLKYAGILIPNPVNGKSLSNPQVFKRYTNALDYVEAMSLPSFLTECARIALVEGSYFGLRVDTDKTKFAVIDLPYEYARSRFKDVDGNDLVEFDLRYFDTIIDEETRKIALSTYPKVVRKAYEKLKRGKLKSPWFLVPKDIGICFSFFNGAPLFLSVIPKTLEYDAAVELEQERNAEEIRKIIVQKIPHLADGRLLFEPDEVAEMHAGTVEMLRGNKNVSVLTSYGDVDAIVAKANTEQTTLINQMEHNIYAQAGVSGELFAAENTTTLEASIRNDISIMMYLGHKFERYITNCVNVACGNGAVSFKYILLPVSYHNEQKFTDSGFKLAGAGYSFLVPALAQGISQKDFINIKNLENDVLKLGDIMKPLNSTYTQPSGGEDEGGRPTKETEEKAETTQKKDDSINGDGGNK